MLKSLDLLFERVAEVKLTQQQMQANLDLNTKAIDQVMRDKDIMAKQVEDTGKVVAQLRLEHMVEEDLGAASRGSSTSTTPPRRRRPVQHPHRHGEPPPNCSTFGSHRESGDRPHEKGQYPRCNFYCSLGKILRPGEIRVKNTLEFSTFLNLDGLLQQLCTWIRMQLNGYEFKSVRMG